MFGWNVVEILEMFLGWVMIFVLLILDENVFVVLYKLCDCVFFVMLGLVLLSFIVFFLSVIVGNGVFLWDEKSVRIWDVLCLFLLCINFFFCNRYLELEVFVLEKILFFFFVV